jgi:UDP-N-acetylmuramyl pentapeptide synthase
VYRALARRALAVADEVAFVGPQAHQVRKLVPESGGALRVFPTVREASEHYLDDLRDGDLVVLKGSNRADHLARILLARTTGVACWRESCRRRRFCDTCDLLHTPG